MTTTPSLRERARLAYEAVLASERAAEVERQRLLHDTAALWRHLSTLLSLERGSVLSTGPNATVEVDGLRFCWREDWDEHGEFSRNAAVVLLCPECGRDVATRFVGGLPDLHMALQEIPYCALCAQKGGFS